MNSLWLDKNQCSVSKKDPKNHLKEQGDGDSKNSIRISHVLPAFTNLWGTKPFSLAEKRGWNPRPAELTPGHLATSMASKLDPAPFMQKAPRVLHCHCFHTHASTFEMHRGISQATCQLFNSAQHSQRVWARKQVRMQLTFPAYYTFSSQLWGGIRP